MIVIRLSRIGKTSRPYFRVVVQDKLRDPWSPAIEELGHLDPRTKELKINAERVKYWISMGAQPTDRINNLFITAGIIEGKKRTASAISNKRREKLDIKRKDAEKKISDAKAREELVAAEKAAAEQAAKDAAAAEKATAEAAPVEEAKVEEVKTEEVAA